MGLPEVSIRRARTGDWQALRALRLRALKSDPLAFGSKLEVKLAYPDIRWQGLATQGAQSPNFSTWVAADPEGHLVGMVVVAMAEGVDNILGLWVDPAFRRHGMGGQLLDRAVGWCREAHPGRPVRLEVNPRLSGAIRLYKSRGFRFTGSERPLGYSSGERLDEMVLPLIR